MTIATLNDSSAVRPVASYHDDQQPVTRLAVLIPCYNEEVTIAKVVSDFKRELPDAEVSSTTIIPAMRPQIGHVKRVQR